MKEIENRAVRILIIDDNNAPFILPLIRCFSDLPKAVLDVLLFSNNNPNSYRYSRYVRKVYHVKGDLDREFETGVRFALKESGADVVIPTREWIAQKVADNRSWMGELAKLHPVSDSYTLETLTDKLKLNRWLSKHDFPHAKVAAVTREVVDRGSQETVPYPLLLKPLKGAGGLGIKRVKNNEQLADLLQNNAEFHRKYMLHNDYMLMEFIPGHDVDISFFALKGKILHFTIQKALSNRGLTFPKSIEFHKDQRLLEIVEKMAKKLGYSGIAHLDFRFDRNREQYVLVDFNARYWNSLQGSRLAGVNFPVLALAHTLGLEPGPSEYRDGYFFYGTSALVQLRKNMFHRTRIPVNFRNSQIPGILKDPVPELMYLLRLPFRK